MSGYITSVALNPAVDRTVIVPSFTAGMTNRILSSRLDPGGKGINVARVAKALGAQVRVVGLLGESNGSLISRSLEHQAIPAEFVPVAGENRVNLKIIDAGTLTELNDTGFTVEPDHIRRLMALVERALADTAVLVLSGSLPGGVPTSIYRDLVAMARQVGVATIVDADGEAAIQALEAGPTLIKPNQEEAERVLERPLATETEILDAAGCLLERGAEMAVISHGARGAALATRTGRWWATPPNIRPGSTVGAGDSMVAGFAAAMVDALPPVDALRLAIAAGAATASLEGTQLCSRDQVLSLMSEVIVTGTKINTGEMMR